MAAFASFCYADPPASGLATLGDSTLKRAMQRVDFCDSRISMHNLDMSGPPPPYDSIPPAYEDTLNDCPPDYTRTDALAAASLTKPLTETPAQTPSVLGSVKSAIRGLLQDTPPIRLDFEDTRHIRSHVSNKKKKQAERKAQQAKWLDSDNEGEGSKDGGDGGSGGGGDGGGAGGDGGGDGGDGDDGGGWGRSQHQCVHGPVSGICVAHFQNYWTRRCADDPAQTTSAAGRKARARRRKVRKTTRRRKRKRKATLLEALVGTSGTTLAPLKTQIPTTSGAPQPARRRRTRRLVIEFVMLFVYVPLMQTPRVPILLRQRKRARTWMTSSLMLPRSISALAVPTPRAMTIPLATGVVAGAFRGLEVTSRRRRTPPSPRTRKMQRTLRPPRPP